ncbi:MAG: hypothetical protein AABX02_03870 [archaeon]
MTKNNFVKLVVCVPKTHMEPILDAMHKHGCGSFGDKKYEGVAFLTFGHGTWIALKGSKPFKGRLNRREMVQEVRIETTCPSTKASEMVKVLRSIHPYEEPVVELYALESVELKTIGKSAIEVLKYK